MEIPPHILKQLNIAGHSNTKLQVSEPALDLASIKKGTVLHAEVLGSKILDTQTKNNLFELLQNHHKQNIPANTDTKILQSSREELEALIKRPELYLNQLNIKGKTLSTLSNILLQKGLSLRVEVRPDGQLQLISNPNKTQTATSSQNASTFMQAYSLGKHLSNPPSGSSIDSQQANVKESGHTLNKQALPIIHQGLRQYLPKQQSLAQTLKVLEQISNSAIKNQIANSHTPTNQKPQALQASQKLDNSGGKDFQAHLNLIKVLVNAILPAEKLSQVEVLKQAITLSGSTLEAKLRAAASQIRETQSSQHSNKGIGEKQLLQTPSSSSQIMREHQIPQDLKAQLLQLIQIPSSKAQQDSAEALQKLFKAVFGELPSKALSRSPTEMQNRLNSAIQQTALNAIARITGLQLRHLINRIQEPSLGAGGGHFELPMRIGDHIYPVVMNIQERFYHEKEERQENQETKEQQNKVKSRWHVFMEFDLDELGTFASDISLIGKQVKTQFWIQQNALWKECQKHLNELRQALESSGIEIEDMQCYEGVAPQKNMNVQHSLVDIRT